MSFAGKVVLITGASSGIGAATAVHLAQLGASLSISGRNKDNLNKVADQCGQSKPFIVTGELTNESDVKNIIDSTIKHYGKLDVLINNAGILESGSIETTSLEQYDRYIIIIHTFLLKRNVFNFKNLKYINMHFQSFQHKRSFNVSIDSIGSATFNQNKRQYCQCF